MTDSTVVSFILSLVVLLFVATAVSVLTERVRMPLSISLVVVGLLLGELIRLYPALSLLAQLQLSEDILLYVFLPTLIFQTAFAFDSRLMLKNIGPVLVLAIPPSSSRSPRWATASTGRWVSHWARRSSSAR